MLKSTSNQTEDSFSTADIDFTQEYDANLYSLEPDGTILTTQESIVRCENCLLRIKFVDFEAHMEQCK